MTTETDGRVVAHTPGPWEIFDNGIGVGVTARWDIAHCSGFDSNRGSAEELANARLLAAAPDLLEALTCARTAIRLALIANGNDVNGREIIKRIDAAIAKATGTAAFARKGGDNG